MVNGEWIDEPNVERCEQTLLFCKNRLHLTPCESAWWLFVCGLSLAEANCDENRDRLEEMFSVFGGELLRRMDDWGLSREILS